MILQQKIMMKYKTSLNAYDMNKDTCILKYIEFFSRKTPNRLFKNCYHVPPYEWINLKYHKRQSNIINEHEKN